MRHAYLLSAENPDSFLKILSFYEKNNVIESIETWQLLKTARNLAAHDYETDYYEIVNHFNTLHTLSDILYQTARKLIEFCETQLLVKPETADFTNEFLEIVRNYQEL